MATEESKRVTTHRKYNCDRINTLIDKGGRWLLRAQAMREGITLAEMIRRAIYARCGLHRLPAKEDLEELSEVRTQAEADYAIKHLQRKEEKEEIYQKVLHTPGTHIMQVDHDSRCVLLKIAGFSDAEIKNLLENRWNAKESIQVSDFDTGHLQRLLSNTIYCEEEKQLTTS